MKQNSVKIAKYAFFFEKCKKYAIYALIGKICKNMRLYIVGCASNVSNYKV